MDEYKPKNDSPNLYSILGLKIDICSEPNCSDLIQKAYHRKVKLCHPDLHPNNPHMVEIFELVTEAYEILINTSLRDAYNNKLSNQKLSSKDFFKLKKAAISHVESQGECLATDQQKLSFVEQMKQIDQKQNFDKSSLLIVPSIAETESNLNNLLEKRRVQHLEYKPEALFDERRFDPKLFNAAFEFVHKKNESVGLVEQENAGIQPWNVNELSSNNFSSIDSYSLYAEDNPQIDFSKQTPAHITKSDLQNLTGANYVYNHNEIDKSYYPTIKNKLQQRELDTNKYENMKYSDYKNNISEQDSITTNYDRIGSKSR